MGSEGVAFLANDGPNSVDDDAVMEVTARAHPSGSLGLHARFLG